ncbi:sugar phosphate nucleotidyltransferase [Gammaproteobacteria bacterium]|nr:sugar phosphate nucleotidyltransferase [Gammaproteobacteria bacterium]
MKGLILSGGNGTRLSPITKAVSKQLLNIFDKPMIYYPLSTLMEMDIRDIALIVKLEDLNSYKALFGDGSHLGINIHYIIQEKPRGLAEAFILGEDYIGNENVTLILGDNIFYGEISQGNDFFPSIHCFQVNEPERYGVIELKNKKPYKIIEKPINYVSDWAVTGLYSYGPEVVNIAKNLSPSKRGELEITDINNIYLKNNNLKVNFLPNNNIWLDTGTFQSLLDANNFVASIQHRLNTLIGSPEMVALRKGWITLDDIKKETSIDNNYYRSLLRVASSSR